MTTEIESQSSSNAMVTSGGGGDSNNDDNMDNQNNNNDIGNSRPVRVSPDLDGLDALALPTSLRPTVSQRYRSDLDADLHLSSHERAPAPLSPNERFGVEAASCHARFQYTPGFGGHPAAPPPALSGPLPLSGGPAAAYAKYGGGGEDGTTQSVSSEDPESEHLNNNHANNANSNTDDDDDADSFCEATDDVQPNQRYLRQGMSVVESDLEDFMAEYYDEIASAAEHDTATQEGMSRDPTEESGEADGVVGTEYEEYHEMTENDEALLAECYGDDCDLLLSGGGAHHHHAAHEQEQEHEDDILANIPPNADQHPQRKD